MTHNKNIRLELLMDAGNGAQKAGDILIKSFAKSGRYVFIEPIIPAEISPPKRNEYSMSGVVIRVSGNELTNVGSVTDFMLVEHEILLRRRLRDKEYDTNCHILIDTAFEARNQDDYAEAIGTAESAGLKVTRFSQTEEAQATIKALNGNGKNMYYLGMLTAIFGLDVAVVEAQIRETFKKLSEDKLTQNIKIYESAYKQQQDANTASFDIPEAEPKKDPILLDGNQALAMGIIDSGIRFFSGYPITPASSIMHTLAARFHKFGGVLHQAEDEISAIGATIGAYYGGTPSVTATSGPGLSLKQEFIGLAASSEIPSIIINVQRGGPSTGLPTRTEQSDLFAAAFGSHGDSAKVVLSVGDVTDCFYAPHMARYLTETLRVPVFIMSDYQTSVSYKVLERFKQFNLEDVKTLDNFVFDRFYMDRLPEGIPMVKENQSTPGDPEQMRRLTGLNTNKKGEVSYTSVDQQRAHEIRNQKIRLVQEALREPELFGDQEGDILIVAWGSGRGALLEAVTRAKDQGYKVGGMHLKIVFPLPTSLEKTFKRYKQVKTVEVTYGDAHKPTPFATLLRSQTLVDVQCGIAKAVGYPLKPREIFSVIKEASR